MELHGHLLYVDITQICGIGCAFCMYADKHATGKSMVLSIQARDNLSALINDPAVKRISVSGEGEPLNNINTFYELLALSRGGNSFEFITSGFFAMRSWRRSLMRSIALSPPMVIPVIFASVPTVITLKK